MTALPNLSSIIHCPSSHQAGRLDLRLAQVQGLTRPTRCVAAPPVQLSRVRYTPDTSAAQFTLVHLGGILADDRYDLAVTLADDAEAEVTTAAATQVLTMPHGHAEQRLTLRLGAASRLAWLPEPVILFGDSEFYQRTVIEMAASARLAYLDVPAPGRLARGEVFRFRRYETRLEVSIEGRLAAAERARLEPHRHDLAAPGYFGDTPVIGSLYILGQTVDAARDCALASAAGIPDLGVTVLPNQAGLLVRLLGRAPSEVRSQLLGLWQLLK